MADIKLVKSIYTGSDVTSLGEVAGADNAKLPGTLEVTGAITATSTINKVTITQPASGSTLTIANGKTLTVNDNSAVNQDIQTTATPSFGKLTISNSQPGDTIMNLVNTANNAANRNWMFALNQSVYGDFNIYTGASQGAAPIINRFSIDPDGTAYAHGYINWDGQSRVSSQFDKTSDTNLVAVTGLTANVLAGKTYTFRAVLPTVSDTLGGVKVAISGVTTTATAIWYEVLIINAGLTTQGRGSALGNSVGVTAVTAAVVIIEGTITVNVGGTLVVQFAQNASNVAASSVLVGGTFIVQNLQ